MKKAVLGILLIICMVFVFACKSQPKSTEDALKAAYDRYRSGLILEGASSYTVSPGDTLSKISREAYNNGLYYPIIMMASSDVVIDPDLIEPDMKLTIPDLQKNLANDKAKSNIKKFLLEIAKIEDNRERADTAKGLRDLSASL